jgi:hypothetical protein
MTDDPSKTDEVTRQVIAVATSITISGVSSWYIWQFIAAIAILQLMLAITTAITIVLVEAITIWFLVVKVLHIQWMSSYMRKNLSPPPEQPPLSRGY